ncbi:hypothetical protein PHYBOEH_012010 [Phytophthora boehmeriae]|uniref:RxLR effector protein n=1 Tax=Phytophthora boehmeriae TaxID=109152 RepID=A0A8T1VGE1_9STRA|nr:hypothetical protein PHYBOEH_012010 [Phytophthora boehmeriae]
MRLNLFVLAIATTLLGAVAASADFKTLKMVSDDSPFAGQGDKHFLRRMEANNEDDDSTKLSADNEERAVPAGLSKLGSSISSNAEKLKFQFWKWIGITPGHIYEKYGFVKMGVKALKNPKYKMWQRFVDWTEKNSAKRITAN